MEPNYLYKDGLYISLEEDREPADGLLSRAEPRQSSLDQTGPVQHQLVSKRQTGLVGRFGLFSVFSRMFLPRKDF